MMFYYMKSFACSLLACTRPNASCSVAHGYGSTSFYSAHLGCGTCSILTLIVIQSVETCCTEHLRAAEEELSIQREEVKQVLLAVQNQASFDQSVLDQQQTELLQQVESSQKLVHSFLQEDLQHDVPTGKWFLHLDVGLEPNRSI